VGSEVADTLDLAQASLRDSALARRIGHTVTVSSVEEAADAATSGFARIPWATLGLAGEEKLAQAGVSVRCLQRADGSLAQADDEPGLVAVVARAY
jgi:prolyl-tRNA synthetase